MDTLPGRSQYSRREFLNYSWASSIALLMAEGGGIALWFGLPRFRNRKYGQYLVLNNIDASSAPVFVREGKFWISNSEEGLAAFSMFCPHLGCLYKWVDANGRFECPCHGAKYTTAGSLIEGPGRHELDRFAMKLKTSDGTLESNEQADPILVDLTLIDEIWVDTSKVIQARYRHRNES